MKEKCKHTGKTNWPVTILLIMGCFTIFFPLYMAVIIAFKKPSEMTNDIMGALSFPSSWSFDNFAEAMRVTCLLYTSQGRICKQKLSSGHLFRHFRRNKNSQRKQGLSCSEKCQSL